jgi:alkylhydroperoxidase family enzyme
VPDTVRADASVHLPDHVLVELTVTIGATMLLNRFATALELPTRPATTERLADEGLDGWEAR